MSDHKHTAKIKEIQASLGERAREANERCGFSQRETSLNAERFVTVLVLGWLREGTASLNQLAELAEDLGISITGSAIHERMEASAVELLQGVLTGSLHGVVGETRVDISRLGEFTAVHITDSTQLSLPQNLSETFKGNNGDAKLKLQVTLNYLTGEWVGLEMMPGSASDQTSALPVKHAVAGSLNIQDLGYFKQERFQDIAQQDAFFVSRYQSQTALYDDPTAERLDLVKHLKKSRGSTCDRVVHLGGRTKLRVRLVARRLSQSAADARRRKAKKRAKEQGQMCSATYLYLLGWDLLITNLDPNAWPTEQIFDLYAIRMQIEWVFRIWKSQLKLDHFGKNWRRERVLCQLYAHLIGSLLCHCLTRHWLWHQDHEYSIAKCVQIIQRRIGDLMRCIRRGWYGSLTWVRQLEESFRSFGHKTKRQKDPSTLQILIQEGLF